jgi:hypothetical protein
MGSMTYSLSNLNYPDSLRTLALGINNRGEVVGAYSLFSLTSASFLYQDGNYVPLGAPGDPNAYTQANAINNRGEIVGNVQISVRAPPHGWLNENGTISNYDVPGSGQTSLNGVNDYGDIVGWYYGDIIVNNSALSGVGSPGQYGFIEQNGQFYTFDVPNSSSTSLQGINDRDQLVGSYVDTAGTHSFFYAQGTLTQVAVPDAVKTSIGGLNDFGEIVGTYTDQAGNTHGFIDYNGRYARFDVPNAGSSLSVSGVNDRGQIVGSYVDSTGSHGFIADPNGRHQHDDNTIQITPVALGQDSMSFLPPNEKFHHQSSGAPAPGFNDFSALSSGAVASPPTVGELFILPDGTGQQFFPDLAPGSVAFAELSSGSGHQTGNGTMYHSSS